MATVVAIPISNQLQSVFIETRRIYEVRERLSQMYSWTALLAAHLTVELPWNMFSSAFFFFSWFWTVGFDSDRAPFSFLVIVFIFPLFYTSFALAVAAMSPNAVAAGLLYSFFFSFIGTL